MIVVLDACAVIYWVEAVEPFHGQLLQRLKTLAKDESKIEFAASRLSRLECLIKPLRDEDTVLQEDFRQFFSAPGFRIIELTASVVDWATEIRARYGLSTPDALQAASALNLPGESLFLTNDRRFDKVPSLRTEIIE